MGITRQGHCLGLQSKSFDRLFDAAIGAVVAAVLCPRKCISKSSCENDHTSIYLCLLSAAFYLGTGANLEAIFASEL